MTTPYFCTDLPGAAMRAPRGHHHQTPPTFFSLKDRILRLLFVAIRDEPNAGNMHLLLHGLHVAIKDIATYESAAVASDEQQATYEASPNAEDGMVCVVCVVVWCVGVMADLLKGNRLALVKPGCGFLCCLPPQRFQPGYTVQKGQ